MHSAKTNKTNEGSEEAVRWLETHADLIPRLRGIFSSYFKLANRDLPWRKTTDPYKLLVAEVLLQKTGSRPVGEIWKAFVYQYPDVKALSLASVTDLERILRPLGLRKRAQILYDAAHMLVAHSGSEMQGDPLFLRSLRGIGHYTVSSVLSFGYNIKAAAIDVNGARVYTRIAGFVPKTLRQGLAFANVVGELVVTEETHREVNYGVLDLAAQICRPKPLCLTCPALSICEYGQVLTKPILGD